MAVVGNEAVPLVDVPDVQLLNILMIETSFCASLTKLVIVFCFARVFRSPEPKAKTPEYTDGCAIALGQQSCNPAAQLNRNNKLLMRRTAASFEWQEKNGWPVANRC